MKITDEMVEAVARVLANDLVEIGLTSESPVASADGKTMPLWETYLNLAYTALTAALAVQTQQGVEVKKLEWIKHPKAELWRAISLLGVYQVHAFKIPGWTFDSHDGHAASGSTNDIEAAKAAAQSDYETRIRSAHVYVPAVESEPVAVPEGWRLVPETADARMVYAINEWTDENPREPGYGYSDAESAKLYEFVVNLCDPPSGHPPRSLSNEGWMPIETVPHNEEAFLGWFDIDGDWITEVGEGSWGWRGELVNNVTHHGSATHWKPLPTPPSTRKGSSEGDGSATITNGGE